MRTLLISLLLLATLAAEAGGTKLFGEKPAQASFLKVDEAFELQPLELREGKLRVSWRIAPEHYLYRHRLHFELAGAGGAKLGEAALPAGEKHEDEHFGVVEVYRPDPQKANTLTVLLPLTSPEPASAIELKVAYQGCADAGLCYPPQERVLEWRP